MRIHLTVKRCETTEEMRARARELADRLSGEEPRLTFANILFEETGDRRTVAAAFALPPEGSLVSQAAAADWATALRELEKRVRRQLEAFREEESGAGTA